ncbi:MAG: PPOX class F420-dependent oxidoreductase [Candidatus Nitrosopolaris sp.]
MSSSHSDRISTLSGHAYMNLETYRKNGMGIATPVWFTIGDDKMIYVVTRTGTGKVKRLRNDSKVRIVPCNMRGQPKAEWLNGNGTFASPEQLKLALIRRDKKYGFKAKLSGLFSRTKGDLIGIRITLD